MARSLAITTLEWQDWGCVPYQEAFRLQQHFHAERVARTIPDQLILLEHPAVITLGRKACEEDLISSPMELATAGIELMRTGRGGRATYHAPGQLILYWICGIPGIAPGVAAFVHHVEELMIRLLADYGIEGHRDTQYPGVWVGNSKIAALGLSVERRVTMHGCSLNVSCDLAAFRHLIPCGIRDRDVTSMEKVLGKAPQIHELKARMLLLAGELFNRSLVERKREVIPQ